MKFPFFTIGHSTRPTGEFIDLLTASEIGIVVDVRTVPRSLTNPQQIAERFLSHCRDFRSLMSMSPNSAASAHVQRILRLTSMPSGRIRVFTTTPTSDERRFSLRLRAALRSGRRVRGGSVVVPSSDHQNWRNG
jgi:hypothetical protein